MVRFASAVACTVLVSLAMIHVYWALGGQAGVGGAIPMRGGVPIFHPGKIGTLVVAILLLAMGAVVAARGGWIVAPLPSQAIRAGSWLIAALFALRAVGDFRYIGFFKTVQGSRFARLDTLLYSPLCVLLVLSVAVAAMSGKREGAL